MTEVELRRAVVEHPDDDAPRLAYAAGCDAHDNKSRGDFIRATVAGAKVDPRTKAAQQLFVEEMRALGARDKSKSMTPELDAVQAAYCTAAGLARSPFSFNYERGFIGYLNGPVADCIGAAPQLCDAEPIRHVAVMWEGGRGARESAADPERFAAMDFLGRLRSLGIPARVSLLAALMNSPHVAGISRLTIYPVANAAGDVGVFFHTLLAALTHGVGRFTGVTRLEIAGLPLPANGIEQLCALPSARQWTRLNLSRTKLQDAGAQVLAATPALAALAELWLADNGITVAGVQALADSRYLSALVDLDLGRNRIDAAGIDALAKRTGLPRLAYLGVDESIYETRYEEWTDWTGGNIGGGDTVRAVSLFDAKTRFPLAGVELYDQRHFL